MYSRVIDDRVLTIASSGWTYHDLFVLHDRETESMWYHLPGGTEALTCIAGVYEGRTLVEIRSAYEPWNKWKRANPGTLVLPARAGTPE